MRRVLRVPADNLRVGLDQSIKELGNRREETIKVKGESDRASKYFTRLVRDSEKQRNDIVTIDLDAPPQGSA